VIKHGFARRGKIHPLHRIWREMIQRCTNPKNNRYKRYGGRGIKVCRRWTKSFAVFLKDVGPRPKGRARGGRSLYSLDRIKNDQDYKPGNVRWATAEEQQSTSSHTRWIKYDSRRMKLKDWAKELGIHHTAICNRVRIRGISYEKAVAFYASAR